MKRRAKGINAAAWFAGQSFNGRVSDLEKEAERNREFYSGSSEDVFKHFDVSGKRIAPEQPEEQEGN